MRRLTLAATFFAAMVAPNASYAAEPSACQSNCDLNYEACVADCVNYPGQTCLGGICEHEYVRCMGRCLQYALNSDSDALRQLGIRSSSGRETPSTPSSHIRAV